MLIFLSRGLLVRLRIRSKSASDDQWRSPKAVYAVNQSQQCEVAGYLTNAVFLS